MSTNSPPQTHEVMPISLRAYPLSAPGGWLTSRSQRLSQQGLMHSSVRHSNDPGETSFRRRPRNEPDGGAINSSPPSSPRQHAAAVFADNASVSSGDWKTDTVASSDWCNASRADLEAGWVPCGQAHTDDYVLGDRVRDDEGSSGSDRPDSIGRDVPSSPGSGGNYADYAAEPPPQNASDCAAPTATAAAGSLLDEEAYQRRFGPQIEAWLSDVERRAAQNTNVYLRDGVTLNPARAPYVSLRGGGSGGWDASGSDGKFWKWSILLQRWIHVDDATGMLLIYPKQLIH